MADITRAHVLADFCAGLEGDPRAATARAAVPQYLLDYLGNAIGGSSTDSARAAQQFLIAQGLSGRATAFGVGHAPAQYAAFVNGVAAHSLEMDDTYQPASLHPGVTAFSAALAALDEFPDGSARFAPAVVAGYEVACRVGAALDPAAHYDRGFHPTATAGVFGAAAAAGLVFGLDASRLVHAFGIAGSTAAGLMEFLADGSWTKRFHAGWAAHSGILAARLAQAGFSGPATVFEGRHGFLRAYSPAANIDALTERLGADLCILRTSLKAHACCRYKQAPIDAILTTMQAHRLREQDVEHLTVGVLSAAWQLIVAPDERKRDPRTVVDAQFSMPYGAAVALVYGRATPAEYRPELLDAADLRRVMTKVRCRRDEALDAAYPAMWPASVCIRTVDGRMFCTRVDFPKGDPENPLSREDVETKFRALTTDILSPENQDRLIGAVAGVEAVDGPRHLREVLRTLPLSL